MNEASSVTQRPFVAPWIKILTPEECRFESDSGFPLSPKQSERDKNEERYREIVTSVVIPAVIQRDLRSQDSAAPTGFKNL